MQEKNISMDDAFQVWWFIFWRTLLTGILISVVFTVLLSFTGLKESFSGVVNSFTVIISILIQVYYFKLALNRNYKSFRLSVTEKNS